MKLLCALVVCTLAITSAEEHPRGKMVQVCGAELVWAMTHVCENGDLEIFNFQHAQYYKLHDHQPEHQHSEEAARRDSKEYALRDTKAALADHCCAKPCYVKDFLSYCP